jgi:hypothetical protein
MAVFLPMQTAQTVGSPGRPSFAPALDMCFGLSEDGKWLVAFAGHVRPDGFAN